MRCVASRFRSYYGASRCFVGYISCCWTISKYDPSPSSAARWWSSNGLCVFPKVTYAILSPSLLQQGHSAWCISWGNAKASTSPAKWTRTTLARGRLEDLDESAALARILSTLPPGALIIGVETDGLFTPSEQHEIAEHIPGSELTIIPSSDGHDRFLLEFELINRHILRFLKDRLPEIYEGRGTDVSEQSISFEVTRTSTSGEAEIDVTMW